MGQPCPGEILEPVRWPLTSGFELLLQSPTVGTQKEMLLSLQGHWLPSQAVVFHSTKHPSSCATQGSGPSTPAEGFGKALGHPAAQDWAGAEGRAPLLWSRVKL